jgi:hypothetical protein
MANPDKHPPEVMARQFGIGKLQRHLFICTGPDCCEPDVGEKTWEYVKKRMKALNIAGVGWAVLSHEVRVFADLHRWADRGGVSGGNVVPKGGRPRPQIGSSRST